MKRPAVPIREGDYEPLDLVYLRDFAEKVYVPILDHYFRPKLIGAEKLPDNVHEAQDFDPRNQGILQLRRNARQFA